MKKLIAIFAFLFFGLGVTHAQVVQKTGHEIKKGAKKVGNKTAELASKGASRVKDKVYREKEGPAGQTIYITDDSRYYWVDKKGHRQYVTDADLKDRQPKVKTKY